MRTNLKLIIVALMLTSPSCSPDGQPGVADIRYHSSVDTVDAPAPGTPPLPTAALEPMETAAAPVRAPIPGYATAANIRDICEPVDDRRPFPTKTERQATIELIRKTCDAFGVDRRSCDYLAKIVSLRESSYRPWARHRLEGDLSASARAYLASAYLYGWETRWAREDQKTGNLAAIQLSPIQGRLQNPYYTIPERWVSGGIGLGGLNIAYSLHRLDPGAPPEILCDPVINTIVQISIGRAAVDKYGANDFYGVQAIYGGRTYATDSGRPRPLSCSGGDCPAELAYPLRRRAMAHDEDLSKRCEDKGIDCTARPNFGRRHKAMTPAEVHALADEIRGGAMPPWDTPRPTAVVVSGFED
jgi:hypothetical protein